MKIAALLRVAFCFVALLGPTIAHADDFYKGKTITLFIGAPPGGTYDIYTRLFARHLGDFIPDNPSVIAESMPGAAGIRVANYLYNAAAKDGTALALSLNNIPLNEFLTPEQVKYHSDQFAWIGRGDAPTHALFTWSGSGIRTIDDAKKRPVLTAVTAPGTATEMYPSLANALLGTRFKLVSGYQGATGIDVAMENGEIEAIGSNAWDNYVVSKPDWIRDHKIIPLFQTTFERDPALPKDTPTFLELVAKEHDRAIVRLITQIEAVGLYLMGPPGMPADRVQMLRQAFGKMVASRDFLTDAKTLRLGVHPMSGDDLQNLVSTVLATPKDVVEAFSKAATPPR